MATNFIAYEKETKGSIKLQSRYAEEDFQQSARFWGYIMQTIYQVGQTHPIQCFLLRIEMKIVT